MKTCVLCFRRRNDFEWTMRSRSRWKGVRRPHSSSWIARPRVSYERTATGESEDSSCSRIRASNASATLPASSGMEPRLDDDRDGSAVSAPGGSGDIAGAIRAQEDDHGRDLLGVREAAERPALANAFENLLAALAGPLCALVGQAAVGEPGG